MCVLRSLLTIVGRCKTCVTTEDSSDGVYPPNIIAWSSSVIVREKPAQGGGLDPFIEGEDHSPKLQAKTYFSRYKSTLHYHLMKSITNNNVSLSPEATHASRIYSENDLCSGPALNTLKSLNTLFIFLYCVYPFFILSFSFMRRGWIIGPLLNEASGQNFYRH